MFRWPTLSRFTVASAQQNSCEKPLNLILPHNSVFLFSSITFGCLISIHYTVAVHHLWKLLGSGVAQGFSDHHMKQPECIKG